MSELWWTIAGLTLGVIVMLPITRLLLRRGEARARRAERRARDAERLAELGSMTGGLAHEIKNPLSTIGLNAQLLAESVNESDLPDEQRDRMLRRIEALSREAERLRAILTDFLQFAGRMRLDPYPHDLVQVIDELADFFHPQCDQARVMLRTQLPDGPVRASIDVGLFKQALLNLMINAVQAIQAAAPKQSEPHSRIGELMLRLSAENDAIRIHVIDTGPGIAPEQLDEIFHPYVSHKAGGTGLGLATSRRIIEEHGGELTAHSEVGRGSDFIITLPRSAEPEPVTGGE